MTMPTFADIFREAEALAVDQQAYEIAALIVAVENGDRFRVAELEAKMNKRDLLRYDAIMSSAYTRLSLKENTRGRIQLS